MSAPDISYWINHESVLHRVFNEHLADYQKAADEYPLARLPEEFKESVHASISRYAGTLTLHPGGPRALFNKLMPVLGMMAAVHTVLRRAGWTVDQIGRLSYEVFRRRFDAMPRIARRVARRFMVSPFFPRAMAGSLRAMRTSGRKDTFFIRYRFRRKPKPATEMQCNQCGMIQFMKAAGLDEMYRYCNIFDFAQADSFGFGLIQPSCIGAGDATCAYIFTRNPADTRYPLSIQRILKTPMET